MGRYNNLTIIGRLDVRNAHPTDYDQAGNIIPEHPPAKCPELAGPSWLEACPRMPFRPNSSELSKNNARNITYMAVLIL